METQRDSSPKKSEKSKKKRSKIVRRFSDEQIKSLESIFSIETKLEPKKKLQLAKDLGLQPRQVAIWFQNRRARWKSKQIEQDYKVLKANYDKLYLKFDDLKREKQSLLMQLEELSDLLKNLPKIERDVEFKEKPDSSNEGIHQNDKGKNIEQFGSEEEEILSWGEEEDISHLASHLFY